jgi:hypothetical protein
MTAGFRIGKAGLRCQFANLKRVTCPQHHLATALLKLPDNGFEKRHVGGVVEINPDASLTRRGIPSLEQIVGNGTRRSAAHFGFC